MSAQSRRVLVLGWLASVLAGTLPALPGDERPDLLLGISAPSLHLAVGQSPDIRAEITNPGSDPVTLVLPGDRSDSGGRTPLVSWQVRVVRQARDPGAAPVRLRCGNINPLTPEEVFELEQEETRELGQWVSLPPFRAPGVYEVQLRYENRPDLEWWGIPLGAHDAGAMKRVRESTPCVLESNVLTFTVR